MPWVNRENGAINCVSEFEQSFATEFVPADDPELVAYLAAPEIAKQAAANRLATIKADAGYTALIEQLKTATPAEWSTYLTNNMTTLAQARTVVYRMGLALMALARQLP